MIEVRTPCRLHFGLLAFSRDDARQFGGVGLMVREPDIVVRAGFVDNASCGGAGAVGAAGTVDATGPMATRAAATAQRFVEGSTVGRAWRADGRAIAVQVKRAPRAHTGLGTGTQMGLAVTRALAALGGCEDHLGPPDLAALAGRGKRSGVGVHGFFHGGLIVEGGKREADALSPMLVQQPFPEDWRIVLTCPRRHEGLAGQREAHAFRTMASFPREATAEMCRLVLLGLLPAVIERDLEGFGAALQALQEAAGGCFKASQGGVFASDQTAEIARFCQSQGAHGVGQSSWGPTIYSFTKDAADADRLARNLMSRFNLSEDEVLITRADNQGSTLRQTTAPALNPNR